MTKEEAIKVAIEMHGWLQTDREREALETLIPELRESEDERIRTDIICLICWLKANPSLCSQYYKDRYDSILAWLEKQKTSEEAIRYVKENHSPDEVSDFQSAMNIAVAKAYDKGVQDTLERQKEEEGYEAIPVESTLEYKLGFKAGKESEKQKKPENVSASTMIPSCWAEEPSLQKEQEPTDEDERILGEIIVEIREQIEDSTKAPNVADLDDIQRLHQLRRWESYLKKLYEQKPEECIPDSVKFDEGFKTGREIGFREGVESVKPAWSEEDEKLFWGFTAYVPNEELERLGVTRDDLLKKLKSLRPLWSEGDIEKNLIAYLRYERKSTPQEIEEKFIPYIKRIKIMEQESVSPMSYGSLDEAMQEAGRRFDLPCTDKDKYSVADVFYAGVRAERESKQEWSEEDEKIAKEIEEELWYPGDFPDYPSKEESELYDDCQRRLDWFKNKIKSLRTQPKAEWSEENKMDIELLIALLRGKVNLIEILDSRKESIINFLKSLPQRFSLQPKQEWSEEDERNIRNLESVLYYAKRLSDETRTELGNFLKSLRPQSKDETYKEKDEAFKLGKHQLAIKFMNYLDENRSEGKMGLSNGECEDIDKAFKENDWAKIMRYYEKYHPHWKPSKEQLYKLSRIAEGVPDDDDAELLIEIYEQLVKLT